MIIQKRTRIAYYKKGKYLEDLVNKRTSELHSTVKALKEANINLREKEMLLQENNKTKDKFFSILAHDLITPFNTILGVLDLLVNKKLDKEQKDEFLEMVYQSARNTHKLLENLLTWSRSQRGAMAFNPKKISLGELYSETISLLEQQAEAKNIKIRNNFLNDLEVSADKEMLSTILRNLISNAIKFSPPGEYVLVDARNEEENSVTISVQDNSVGIKPEIQSKLFKNSEDVSTRGTNKEKGTGLGLIICKEFVEKHNGKIWVESKLGEGSSFSFNIPVAK